MLPPSTWRNSSRTTNTTGKYQAFDIDLTGARQITLGVLNGADGYVCDHAAWGLARFLEPDAKDSFVPSP
jgi:hypothetical protein